VWLETEAYGGVDWPAWRNRGRNKKNRKNEDKGGVSEKVRQAHRDDCIE